jgi:uncharacterized protein DUF3152
MIDTHRHPARLRPWWWAAFVAAVVVMVLGGTALADGWVRQPGTPTGAELPLEDPVMSTSPSPPAPTPPPDPLQEHVAVPAKGTGRFQFARGNGPVLGRSGALRTFHVAVEIGSGQSAPAFAATVQATLADKRSWIGGRTVRLQRVAPNVPASFTVYLATRTTAWRMCRRGGSDTRLKGVPFTSCRTVGKAIINLDRWVTSAPPYVAAKVPLAVYRAYVINHEVGHELGHGHEGCPKLGGLAPVMVQQTLSLRGCVPNAWPRPKLVALAGPPA